MSVFRRLLGLDRRELPNAPEAVRMIVEDRPAVIYAVGDVHGNLQLLRDLEALIVADARSVAGEKWIVMLGDYVDRGPDSAQVIDHLLSPPPAGFRRYCIAGNHETEMASFLRSPRLDSSWLEFGGRETLYSYGIPDDRIAGSRRALQQLIASHVPDEHVAFISGLPVLLETPDFVFVHAGIRPGVATADQSLHDLLWYRDDFAATYDELSKTVVHGHTIREQVLISPHRIGVDTGAFVTGRLSAVKLTATGGVTVIEARQDPAKRL